MSGQRVREGQTATITEILLDGQGGLPGTAPTAAEATITNDAGTELQSGLAAIQTGNPSEFRVGLTTVDTAQLDRLRFDWTSSVGTMTTYVEVVGEFFFSLAELRAQSTAFANTTDYPNTRLAELRTTVEQALEDACGVAFVPRYSSAPLNSDYTISRTDLRVIRGPTGQVRNGKALTGYEYGMDSCPAPVKQAALILAKSWGVNGPIDSRTTSFTSEVGVTSVFSTPGIDGVIFGIPAVDAVVAQYSGGTVDGMATVPMTAYTGPVWTTYP